MTEMQQPFRSTSLSSVTRGIRDGTHGTFLRTTEGRPLLSAKNVRDGYLEISDSESLISHEDFEAITKNGFPRLGDVLLTIVGSIGRTAVYNRDEPAAFQRSVGFIRPSNALNSHYASYQFTGKHFQDQLMLQTKASAQPGVYLGDIGSCKVFVPDSGTQLAIVEFLDRETAEIDAFIADQEKLIALLTERRAATITHTVTKGLNPSAPMKDSGVGWLGDVPEHWVIGRVGSSVASAKNGVWGEEPGGAEDIRCVRVADFDRPSLRIHDRNVTYRAVRESERRGRVLRRGDVLLEKSGGGDKSPVGFVVLYDRDEPAVTSNFVARVQLRAGMDPRYWTYVHSSNYSRRLTTRSIKQSTGIQNLDQASYFAEAAPLPPDVEQIAIANHLDHETAEIDATIADAREAITLSKERRAALISAAVTGKIDVRGGMTPDEIGSTFLSAD